MQFAKIFLHVIAAIITALSAPLHADPAPLRPIYRCEVAGVVTFADLPCDSTARQYQTDASRVSTYAAPPVSKVAAAAAKQNKSAKRRAGSKSSVDSHAKQVAECARISGSLKDIHSKMRSGYTAKQGERLKERQAKLDEQRRAKRCR
jgi:hypothetical protein